MVLLGGRWLKLGTLNSLVNVISDAKVSIGFLGLTVDSLPLAIRCNSVQLPCVSFLCSLPYSSRPPASFGSSVRFRQDHWTRSRTTSWVVALYKPVPINSGNKHLTQGRTFSCPHFQIYGLSLPSRFPG